MIEGHYTATIDENDIRAAGSGTEFVYLRVVFENDETMPIQIWLTEKAMGMARAQLRQCGFDADKDSLAVLSENNAFLRGRKVPVEVYTEEYKGRETLKAKIQTNAVSKKRIESLGKMLRSSGREEPISMVPEDDIPF